MHGSILEAGRGLRLLAKPLVAVAVVLVCTGAGALVSATAAQRNACPAAQAAPVERLFSADCADCWSAPASPIAPAAPGAATPGPATWQFDWITPGSDGAPLAAGALPEAADRLARLGLTLAGTSQTLQQRRAAAPPLSGLRINAASGPAWQGYFGVQLTLQTSPRTALPAGSTAWLALVEQVPAGSDGTPIARSLLRSVAGPLPLTTLQPGKPLTHLRALRWPTSAEPTRLQARAWVEGPDGRLLAVAADACR
jgi:hypothetical protein